MLVAFLVVTLAHAFQAIKHRKSFCWVLIMSCLWQTLAYVFRVLSIENPDNLPLYALWFVLILVSVKGFTGSAVMGWCSPWGIGCPSLDECVCVYGNGKNGLEFHRNREDLGLESLEVCAGFCGLGSCVRSRILLELPLSSAFDFCLHRTVHL